MLASFISFLQKFPSEPGFENLYRGRSKFARLRRKNLHIYLEAMQARAPRHLLVGEAPGYKGCKRTGVPFSCEHLLLTEAAHPILGAQHGYVCMPDQDSLEKERSALMVWNCLDEHRQVPLIWNIFPFHPFLPDNPSSNRSPRVGELRMGSQILRRLLDIYPIESIAAVGRKAFRGISEMNLSTQTVSYVRHPSYGGKSDFEKGMAKFFQEP